MFLQPLEYVFLAKLAVTPNGQGRRDSATVAAIKSALNSLSYKCVIRSSSDNCQFDSSFDMRLAEQLRIQGLICSSEPNLPFDAAGRRLSDGRADLVVRGGDGNDRVVVEIEKSDRGKLYVDLMKLWLFIDSGVADRGVLIVPTNYAHVSGRHWNLYSTACDCVELLRVAARIPETRLELLSVIGYEQALLLESGEVMIWNQAECKRVKAEAKRHFNGPDR